MFQNWVLHLNPHLFSSSFFFFFFEEKKKKKKNPFSRLVFLPIFLDQPYHFDFHSFLVGLCLWDGEETTSSTLTAGVIANREWVSSFLLLYCFKIKIKFMLLVGTIVLFGM
jgi:hypothetical protein